MFAKGKKAREANSTFWSEISTYIFLFFCFFFFFVFIFQASQGLLIWGFFFLLRVARKVAERPIIAVYHHVRRLCHPMRNKGPWQKDEDDRLAAYVSR